MDFSIENLTNFEKEIIEQWEKGETYGPIHLSGGNEKHLIKIFKKIKSQDWIFSTHRNHYHALLKSKNPKWLINEILVKANSSHINSKKYKIFTSAIVGGNLPIALGVAMGIKRKKGKEKVYCFIGDMASEMGCFYEAQKYAINFDLPITFIIEDNILACESPTNTVWGKSEYEIKDNTYGDFPERKIIYYQYTRHFPHCGTGKMLRFKKRKFKSTGNYDAYK